MTFFEIFFLVWAILATIYSVLLWGTLQVVRKKQLAVERMMKLWEEKYAYDTEALFQSGRFRLGVIGGLLVGVIILIHKLNDDAPGS